jgi:hypothetical protein
VCGIASGKSCFDCEQQFCANHIYSCADCGNQYCGDCLDAHHADGHWSDSDTAFEFAASRGVVCASFVNSLDLRRSEFAAPPRVPSSLSVDLRRSSPVGGNQHAQASWFAIPIKLLSQHLTRLAKLISFMVQNVALQSEAGS